MNEVVLSIEDIYFLSKVFMTISNYFSHAQVLVAAMLRD